MINIRKQIVEINKWLTLIVLIYLSDLDFGEVLSERCHLNGQLILKWAKVNNYAFFFTSALLFMRAQYPNIIYQAF